MAASRDASVRAAQVSLKSLTIFASAQDILRSNANSYVWLRPVLVAQQKSLHAYSHSYDHDQLSQKQPQSAVGCRLTSLPSRQHGNVLSACKHVANATTSQHRCLAAMHGFNRLPATSTPFGAIVGGLSTAPVRQLASAAGPSSAADVSDTVECVVIGAGVVGLAVARALALRGREVVVVEAAGAVGTETSSRHSEVIHAGIYYPPGSLKARMCVEGKARLYDFCRTHNVPYKNITKLVVANSKDQLPSLASLRATAAASGVTDLRPLSGAEARALEPALAPGCAGALLSPSTGILDSHSYMSALLSDAEAHGALLALHTWVAGGWLEPAPLTAAAAAGGGGGGAAAGGAATGGACNSSTSSSHSSPPPPPQPPTAATAGAPTSTTAGASSSSSPAGTTTSGNTRYAGEVPYKVLELHSHHMQPPPDSGGTSGSNSSSSGSGGLQSGGAVEVSRLRARWVVNAAGLHAVRLAGRVAGGPGSALPTLHLAKGNYFSLAGRCPFSRLIYPVPELGLAGLGTHLTLDMGGGARFGPDVEWLQPPGLQPVAPDYRVDPRRCEAFYPAIRRFFPGLPDGALQPAYSGVRPKLSGPGEPAADFLVQGAVGGHGVRGWVNLFGIESPGLTSSLALAEHVCKVLEREA